MISPQLNMALVHAKQLDLRRAAIARNHIGRQAQPGPPVAVEKSVTLRFGVPGDENRLARLAALDSSKSPAQPVLLAEVDGQLLAALGLSDGTVVSDPFHLTADLIDLLRARARQLDSSSPMRQSGRWRSWSRLRAPA